MMKYTGWAGACVEKDKTIRQLKRITQLKQISALIRIGKKLRAPKTVGIVSNGEENQLSIDDFTDEVLTTEEAEKILNIIKNEELLFYPAQVYGQSTVYTIARVQDIDGQKNLQEIIKFRQRQMPQEYDFKRLSKDFAYFNSGPDYRRPAVVIGSK